MIKESWVWESELEELIKQKMNGYTLNVPCGTSKLGNVRVDLDPQHNPDYIADMRKLPFENNTFDTVISDPPWNLGYFQRFKPFYECIRVCKVDGIIIYNARWIPETRICQLIDVWVRQSAKFGNISVMSIFKKIRDESCSMIDLEQLQLVDFLGVGEKT